MECDVQWLCPHASSSLPHFPPPLFFRSVTHTFLYSTWFLILATTEPVLCVGNKDENMTVERICLLWISWKEWMSGGLFYLWTLPLILLVRFTEKTMMERKQARCECNSLSAVLFIGWSWYSSKPHFMNWSDQNPKSNVCSLVEICLRTSKFASLEAFGSVFISPGRHSVTHSNERRNKEGGITGPRQVSLSRGFHVSILFKWIYMQGLFW